MMHRTTSALVAILSTLLVVVSVTNAGDVVHNDELGFTITMPDGFDDVSDMREGDIIYMYRRLPEGDQQFGDVVRVSRLGGAIAPGGDFRKEQLAQLPPGTSHLRWKWKGHEVDVLRMPQALDDGTQVVTYAASVPLTPTAIMVSVMGEASRDAEVRDLTRDLFGTVEGPTNWPAPGTAAAQSAPGNAAGAAPAPAQGARAVAFVLVTACFVVPIGVVLLFAILGATRVVSATVAGHVCGWILTAMGGLLLAGGIVQMIAKGMTSGHNYSSAIGGLGCSALMFSIGLLVLQRAMRGRSDAPQTTQPGQGYPPTPPAVPPVAPIDDRTP